MDSVAANEITNDFMRQEIARARTYFVLLLRLGPKARTDEAEMQRVQWEHVRHLFRLRQMGLLVANGPCLDDGDLRGIGIFVAGSAQDIEQQMAADPMIQAGYLVAEIHPFMSFPGDTLL